MARSQAVIAHNAANLHARDIHDAMRRATLAALALAAVGIACAHEGASFEDDVFHKGDLRVQVGPVPPGWRRVGVDSADLAFRDDARSGSVLFDVRCGQRDDDAPLSSLTEHLIMGTTERAFDTQEVVPFDHREAMHTVLRAKLDGVPMQYDIFVMKKDGCLYDIVYVAPPDRYAEGAADFERFARGVHSPPGDTEPAPPSTAAAASAASGPATAGSLSGDP
jgi:hypothetical protein